MELTGKISGVSVDFFTKNTSMVLEINEPDRLSLGYEELKDIELLDIRIKKYRKKRSLDANAYAWVLMSEIAKKMGISKDEVYEIMLERYGALYFSNDGYVTITLKASIDKSVLPGHWLTVSESNEWKGYLMIKGSSEYDTKEMSVFIEGIVSECKELGIDTLTPDELERMKQQWKA